MSLTRRRPGFAFTSTPRAPTIATTNPSHPTHRFVGHEGHETVTWAICRPWKRAIDAFEYADEREPTGSYALFNAVDPAVAT